MWKIYINIRRERKEEREREREKRNETYRNINDTTAVKNLFTGSAAIVRTRLCRLCGYFVAFVREVRLNENLLYIPCMLFPLPFFSSTHILINGSFLCECNVRETKSRRRDRSRFYRFLCFLSLFLSLFLPILPFSSRGMRMRACSNRDMRKYQSCFFTLESFHRSLRSNISKVYNSFPLFFFFPSLDTYKF